ncbi:zinc finger protein 480-like [Microplitis demolitor]|uniref:zinc finger protein 480-like n=1 Tax=Microplitis demolitor TaxID=69319 RepID=UPI00235B7014|nr:zinc finger protein 480-like [Microplitis demolitor]
MCNLRKKIQIQTSMAVSHNVCAPHESLTRRVSERKFKTSSPRLLKPVIFKCSKCEKSYQRQTSLRRHLKLECGVEPKQVCFYCGKKFIHKFNLSQHFKSYFFWNTMDSYEGTSGEDKSSESCNFYNPSYKFICPRCGKTYKSAGSLSRHRHYECGIEPKEKCNLCGKKFPHKFKLTRHLVSCKAKQKFDWK